MGGEKRWDKLTLGASGFLVTDILFSLSLLSSIETAILFLIKSPFKVSRKGINHPVCMPVYIGKI